MSMADLINGEAELDDEENDGSFDEDAGEAPRKKKDTAGLDDSSEEEEDDDDEEAARAVREGFIIDDEEDEIDNSRGRRNRKERHKKRSRDEEEAALDEEDLDLIGEANPEWERKTTTQPKLKRLKRGHRDDGDQQQKGLDDIFSDDEEPDANHEYERPFASRDHHQRVDEFADFIEEDDLEDEDERQRAQEELEVARPRERGYVGAGEATGLDKDALDDMEAIFGTGEDYDWALAMEEDEEAREAGEHNLELKDVFEPSQLTEKLLTDEDNQIRWLDEPERFQLDRAPFKNLHLSEEQFKEEARWITSLIWPKKQLASDLQGPFQRAIGKVLEFFVVDVVEVPYVFQHRKDYLIYAKKTKTNSSHHDNLEDDFHVTAEKLLVLDDLWRVLELDLKFRALIEKRNILEKTYDNLKATSNTRDRMVEAMLPVAVTMEELQDIQDYIYFQYSTELKELAATTGEFKEKRRPGGKSSMFERIRKGRAYELVQAYGILPDQVAQNALREGPRQYIDDATSSPIDFADSLASDSEFSTGEQVLTAARQMYGEELFMNPRMRKHFRMHYYMMGVVNCRRTEKGLRKIDEQHPYYELKYIKNQTFSDIANKPEMFLKMLKAEEEGLLEVKVVLQNEKEFRRQLLAEFQSENYSELADAWNDERKNVLDLSFAKLERVITKGVKESMRTECQDSLLKICREEYSKKLDQAPYKPKGMVLGTIPRVLALSNGMGDQRDAICWAWVEEDGRVLESGKFNNLSRDEESIGQFVDLVQRRRPDVLGVCGFSVETHRLVAVLRKMIDEKNLRGPEFEDQKTGEDRREPLEVVVANDEVARLYKDSTRAQIDHPTLPPLTRYCVALAKYMQNPMKEYAALGKDIISLQFHPSQQLLPEDKLRKQLETAMVDMVNLCGVDINDAISDPYTANLLPYVCGLGPRKSTAVLKTINQNGGVVNTRDELVGDPDHNKLPVVGPRVWNNCASFLLIEYDSSVAMSDYLDNTRVHPEDYELGRKMAADALELDEEDVKAEVDEGGPGAIVRKMIRDDDQEKVNDLILEEYADQLERNYNQRKRATLETIRAELQNPYEELRRKFAVLSDDEIFTMLTGETRDSLCEGMVVSVNIRIAKEEMVVAKLDSGIEGKADIMEGSDRQVPLNRIFSTGQVTQAKLLEINRADFTAVLSLRESVVRVPYRKRVNHDPSTWDVVQEHKDKEELKAKDKATGRAQRVVKHPLFRPFNSTQAEEYLGSQAPGDAVIRPSSKGNDHLAVTWKVADGVYQHIDVVELDKESEFSVGRKLRIGNKYNYSDLDELIVDHVKAMAKKVDEIMQHEKYQSGSRNDTENWLHSYTKANPKRSVYAFCLDSRHPGYFYLCFKAGENARVNAWPVRIVPNAFELMKNPYPDMRALCNGFKMRVASESQRR
ncbi:putative transcription elongation factor SPT6 [Amylocarpus encephaloides]|uniref:Transcription elongation factor Spt6 n=1 Tax=Amylocarpus encephaloides TaxID=45428 RepID=A0A9P8C8Q4_9HELO|nr:putative transcription elongation factor SPT6 [Amylocarpus encephaloides]